MSTLATLHHFMQNQCIYCCFVRIVDSYQLSGTLFCDKRSIQQRRQTSVLGFPLLVISSFRMCALRFDSLCNRSVCISQKCSLFYTKRFCITCVKENWSKFPPEIAKVGSVSCCTKWTCRSIKSNNEAHLELNDERACAAFTDSRVQRR